MKEFYSILHVICDLQYDGNCWGEDIVRVEEGETKEQAEKFLKDLGWNLNKKSCGCPYCVSNKERPQLTPELLIDNEG